MLVKLNEDSRNTLLAKARKGANYKTDQSKGKNRYERRTKSKISNSVKEYNQLDMKKFFDEDILDLYIMVHGETDDYMVGISFSGILELIREETGKEETLQVDLRLILKMLKRAFNKEDHVLVRCDCPDFRYRFGYWASVNDLILGEKEDRPSDITNPDNKLGPACKHVILILSNNSWVVKLASAVNNYINYVKDHYERAYAEIIYPKLYGRDYNKDVQLGLFDPNELHNTNDIIKSEEYKGLSNPKSKFYISDRTERLKVRKAILDGTLGVGEYRNLCDPNSNEYIANEEERCKAIDAMLKDRERAIANGQRAKNDAEVASANRYGGSRTQFKVGNKQGIRFAPNEITDDDQLELDLT